MERKHVFNRVGFEEICDITKNVKIVVSGPENVSYAKLISERLNISPGKLEEYYNQEKKISHLYDRMYEALMEIGDNQKVRYILQEELNRR